jgi:hypothetical protein
MRPILRIAWKRHLLSVVRQLSVVEEVWGFSDCFTLKYQKQATFVYACPLNALHHKHLVLTAFLFPTGQSLWQGGGDEMESLFVVVAMSEHRPLYKCETPFLCPLKSYPLAWKLLG